MDPDNSNVEEIKRPRGPVARFFMSGWTNIVRLMAVNVLFIVFNIPAIIISYFYSIFVIPALWPSFNLGSLLTVTAEDGTQAVSYQMFMLLMVFFITLMVSSLLVCVGPFQAGFSQVYKDMRNGCIVSVFSSFKQGLKGNWKKGLIVMINGMLVSAVMLLSINFYLRLELTVAVMIGGLFMLLFIMFILIQNYVYQLMVSTDLSVGKLYKNAILLVLIKFGNSLGFFIIITLLYVLVPFYLLMSASYLTLGIFLFFYSFLVIAWVQYMLSYYSGYLIDKYVAEDNADPEGPFVHRHDDEYEFYIEDENDYTNDDSALELDRDNENDEEDNPSDPEQ